MGNRTALVVIVVASAMLLATVAFQADDAVAGTTQSWIEQIHAIKAEAWAAMDETVAPVAVELESATTDGEAKSIRDTARGIVDDIYQLAKDDLESVVDSSLEDPDVKSASEAAIDALNDHKSASKHEIEARYDAWKFRFDAPPAEEVIGKLDEKLAEGLGKIADDLNRYANDLGDADKLDEADEERGKAFERLANKMRETIADLDTELADRYFDPLVQNAYAADLSELRSTEATTAAAIIKMHEAWVAEHFPSATTTTTTTTRPPTTTTTTTLPPATTTTGPATTTTTTTLAPAALLPSTEPPAASDVAYMSEPPAPVVLSESLEAADASGADSEMATVGFVRRVVDSQLPAGVATVAAGPLVVLGLILDAILAAGTLMLIPWVILGVYMLGLLRHQRLDHDA